MVNIQGVCVDVRNYMLYMFQLPVFYAYFWSIGHLCDRYWKDGLYIDKIRF